jgi:hypothetical protein
MPRRAIDLLSKIAQIQGQDRLPGFGPFSKLLPKIVAACLAMILEQTVGAIIAYPGAADIDV